MSLTPGSRLGPYEILSLLGAGGMGEVWRAKDTRLGRDVAVKVLPEDFLEGEERRARFEREAKLLAALNHPNIAAIYSFEEIPGSSFSSSSSSSSSSRHLLVMELVEGEALSKRMKAGAISMGEALSIGHDIAAALEAAHAKGIVHRDLKPGNVMISTEGRVKLLDFGLAKVFEKEPSSPDLSHSPTLTAAGTEMGVILGTAAYMSPEQARGQRVDARTDVWAFGAVLWELLTGRRLFRGESTPDTLAAVLREPVDFKVLPLSTPREVRDLLARCLDRDPEKRLADIGEARRALERAVAGSARIRVPGLTLIVAAAVLILLVVGGVFFARRWTAAPAVPAAIAPSIAVLPFTNLGGDKDQEYFSDGLSEELMGLLTRVKDLKVTGRTSSFAFKGKTEDLRAIGQKLNVATVLEGSVRRSGDRLRVATRLVNVADGYQVWAETYDRKMTDVFMLQDEIAGAVVAALKVKLLPQERSPASQHRTSNIEAYNQYLLGRQFYGRANGDGYRRSAAAYEGALALDPNYAAAYAGLARSLNQLGDFVDSAAEQLESQRKALWAAERAVAIDPLMAEGYSARANSRTYISWDWAGAQADFERALSLNPGDPLTHAHKARLFARLGRLPEAIAEARKATELEPLWVGGKNILGAYLYSTGQLPEARKVLSRALEISPENEYARFFLGVTALLEGNPKEALAGLEPPTSAFRKTMMALALHDLGRDKESQEALDELIAKHGQTSAYHVAEVYAHRGEADLAFEWIDRAYVQRNSQLATLKYDPLVAKLRGDARYLAMLKKLNLPVSN